MNNSASSQSNSKPSLKKNLQLSALVILPLFIFALVVKVQERQEGESSTTKMVNVQTIKQQNYNIQNVSLPVNHTSKSNQNSDSAK